MTIGRPSIITQNILQKLREAFLMGCNDEEACAYAQIGQSTLYDFQKSHPEFSEQKKMYKMNPKLKAIATVYKSLNDVKVAMWYLERKLPEEYSLRSRMITKTKMVEFKIEYITPQETKTQTIHELERSTLELA